MVFWITGKSGSGKTTLAARLAKMLRRHPERYGAPIILDGDEVRGYFPDSGFTDKKREEHIMRIARFAAILEKQGYTILIALISPKKIWRQKARALFDKSELLYLPDGTLWRGTKYEVPDQEEFNGK